MRNPIKAVYKEYAKLWVSKVATTAGLFDLVTAQFLYTFP